MKDILEKHKNIDNYTKLLWLRLVKLIVNFDDPTTYHLYYGDEIGHPGTILIFFPWPDAPKGYIGTGQSITTSFLIPPNSIFLDIFFFQSLDKTHIQSDL